MDMQWKKQRNESILYYRSKYTDEAIQSQFYHINLDSNSGVHFFYSSIRCMAHFYFGKVSIGLVVMN